MRSGSGSGAGPEAVRPPAWVHRNNIRNHRFFCTPIRGYRVLTNVESGFRIEIGISRAGKCRSNCIRRILPWLRPSNTFQCSAHWSTPDLSPCFPCPRLVAPLPLVHRNRPAKGSQLGVTDPVWEERSVSTWSWPSRNLTRSYDRIELQGHPSLITVADDRKSVCSCRGSIPCTKLEAAVSASRWIGASNCPTEENSASADSWTLPWGRSGIQNRTWEWKMCTPKNQIKRKKKTEVRMQKCELCRPCKTISAMTSLSSLVLGLLRSPVLRCPRSTTQNGTLGSGLKRHEIVKSYLEERWPDA